MKRAFLFLAVIVLLGVAIAVVTYKNGPNSSAAETEVRTLVADFGDRLKNVSLLSPTVAVDINREYGEFVAPELLASWTTEPKEAPGRLTSSPWPERIEITEIMQGRGKYAVRGRVHYVTSAGPASAEEVSLVVERVNGKFLITGFEMDTFALPPPPSDLKTYEHADPDFSLTYPAEFSLTEGDSEIYSWSSLSQATGTVYATLSLPRGLEPGTNFSEAKITVGGSREPTALTDCAPAADTSMTLGKTQIGGLEFETIDFSEGAAGNFYETTSYRLTHEGRCFAIETVIHSTNIGVYDPGTVREFDQKRIKSLLESVVQSFKFN